MAGRFKVTGHKGVSAAFRSLKTLIGPPANEAARYALQPALAAAKATAPKRTGALKKSLTIKRDSRSPQNKPTYVVGPDKKSRAVHYAHLVEFGRIGSKDGKGAQKATRFLTNAYEATKQQVAQRWAQRIGPAIEKRADKLAKKVSI